jgi:hypothetical protein
MQPLATGSRLVGFGLPPVLAQATAPTTTPTAPPTTAPTGSANGAVDINNFFSNFMDFLPSLIWAIVVLVVGLILASIVAWAIRGLLRRTSIDERLATMLAGTPNNNINLEKWVGSGVFWIIALLSFLGFLNALNLTAVSGPVSNLLDTLLQYLPRIVSALVLLAIAWALATIVNMVVTRALEGFNLDDRLAENTGVDPRESSIRIHETLGQALYWFIFLLFLPPILNTLALNGLLAPVQGLINQFLSAIPQIITALLVFGAGWLLAKIARGVVTNLLSASGIDNVGRRLGLSRSTPTGSGLSLSGLAGTLTYVFILIPFAIAALNELDIQAISVPAVSMLNQILNFIPLALAAGVVLTVFYFIGRFVADLISNLLTSAGFDNILEVLGLPDITPAATSTPYSSAAQPGVSPPSLGDEPRDFQPGATTLQSSTMGAHRQTPSELVGFIALVGIVLFGAVTATEILQLDELTLIVRNIMAIAAQVLVGLVIFAIGLYLANLAYRLIKSSGTGSSNTLAQTARVVILAFVGALALGQMGVATSIVNLAFGLLLGAVAVAIAIAFGLGGRDVAGRQLQAWLNELKR